jgi:hypothetical protein
MIATIVMIGMIAIIGRIGTDTNKREDKPAGVAGGFVAPASSRRRTVPAKESRFIPPGHQPAA